MTRQPMDSPVLLSLTKTVEECKALKARCMEAKSAEIDVPFLSTNDAVVAELASSLGMESEKVPLSMLYDFRREVGGETLFGNSWVMPSVLITTANVNTDADATMSTASTSDTLQHPPT
jgi:hypothetical protein